MPVETKETSKLPLIFIALVFVLLIAGGVAFLLFFNRSEPVKEAANTNPSATNSATVEKTTITKTGSAKKIFTGGYADPSIIKKKDGTYLMYLNKFGNGPSGYLVLSSKDAKTWKEETGIIFPGISVARAFQTKTGIRFYYPEQMPLAGSTDPMPSLLSAFSTDGLAFKKEAGARVKPRDGYFLGGSTVFTLPNGKLRMYFEEPAAADPMKRKGVIWGASSSDGLKWTRDSSPSIEPETSVENAPADWPQALHPFVVTEPDGTFLMFYNTHSKIYAAESKDGLSWTKLGDLGIDGADADGVYLPNGNFRLYYGDFDEKTGGEVFSIDLTIS
ncbi:MAG: hypothetical protein Q8P13_03255 [bacterium]|nr:hypothetical protein [bacterium]